MYHMVELTKNEHTDKLALELRRGVIILAVLRQLHRQHYGYSLRQQLAEMGLDINEGTLYPLLRRLESQGLLESEWIVTESRPRRYYRSSKLGQAVCADLEGEWNQLSQVMKGILAGEQAGDDKDGG